MRTKSSFNRLILIAISAILLMSIVPIVIRWINANPTTIGIVRLAIGVIGIAILAIFSKPKLLMKKNELLWLVLLGFIFALHWYSYFTSIKMASASLAAIGVATFGIHLSVISSLFNLQKFKPVDVLAIFISLTGIYLTSSNIDIEQTKFNGFLLAIFSGFLYACLPIINQQIKQVPTQTKALGQFGFGLIGFMFLLPQADFDLTVSDWQGLLILGVLSTLVAHTLWIKVTTELPNNLTAVIYYSYVPTSLLLSFFILGEPMSWQKILGAVLIISANILVIVLHKRQPNDDLKTTLKGG